MDWINIKDSLPLSPAMFVVCYAELPGNRTDYWIAQYINDKWVSQYKGFEPKYITHWMYLPREPK